MRSKHVAGKSSSDIELGLLLAALPVLSLADFCHKRSVKLLATEQIESIR
jgi:hypothetical protein